MRRQARRIASMSYLTLAVDLFSEGGNVRCLVSTMRALLSRKGRAFADIKAARRWFAASTQRTRKVGLIGFCMGGGFALLSAQDFDVAASNYGQLLPHDSTAPSLMCRRVTCARPG
jgi:carboxymethylenebutenolidase